MKIGDMFYNTNSAFQITLREIESTEINSRKDIAEQMPAEKSS